jgi:hypothetical protein
LPSEKIIGYFLNLNAYKDKAINEYFNEGGFSSSCSILNLGSSFIYLVISVPLLILTLLVKKLNCHNSKKCCTLFKKIFESIQNKFYLNYFLRMLLEDYLLIILAVAININEVILSNWKFRYHFYHNDKMKESFPLMTRMISLLNWKFI